jgi:hypothetical protein
MKNKNSIYTYQIPHMQNFGIWALRPFFKIKWLNLFNGPSITLKEKHL